MRAILEGRMRIPEDVAVVGCGNLSYSDFLRVPLSSVDQGSESTGNTQRIWHQDARKKARLNRGPNSSAPAWSFELPAAGFPNPSNS